MSTDVSSIARLERVHAAVFSTGTVATLFGIVLGSPRLLLGGGACLVVSGGLILAGSRIRLRGPFGDALRLALGRRRVATIYARGVGWIVLGLLLIALAALSLREDGALPLGPSIAADSP